MAAAVNVHTETIPDGDAGTFVVLERMRQLAQSRVADPVVRRVAVDLARGVPVHHLAAQVDAIRRFLERRVPFLADPDGPELLHDPVILLQDIAERGTARGDCDDVALLGATLGGAIGLPARFVVVGFEGPTGPFGHVWTELFDGRMWRELDVTRPRRAADAPAISRQHIVDVTTGEVHNMAARYQRVARYPVRHRVALGFDPATITAVTGFLTAVLPWLSGSKEPDRIRATDIAYDRAIAGDPVALLFLRQRTGQFGVITIPGFPGPVGGWGSETARAYAQRKYQDALARLGTSGPPPLPNGATNGAAGPLAEAGIGSGATLALLVVGAVVVTSLLGRRGRSS